MVQSATRPRILLVEGDPRSADTLRSLLEAWGHDVLVAADPETAAALAGTLRPGAVLLDLRRSGADGFEAGRALRALPWGAAPALMAAVGPDERAVRLRAWKAGCTHFLPIPLDEGQLRAMLSVPAARLRGGHAVRQVGRA